jgi:hypothetical protein
MSEPALDRPVSPILGIGMYANKVVNGEVQKVVVLRNIWDRSS